MKTNLTFRLAFEKKLFRMVLPLIASVLFCCQAKAWHNTVTARLDTLHITTNTTWNDSVPHSYNFTGQPILVEDGCTLTINNLELWFLHNARIMSVDSPRNGAHLVISNCSISGDGSPTNNYFWGGSIHFNGRKNGHGYTEYSSTLMQNDSQSSVVLEDDTVLYADTGVGVWNHAIVQATATSFKNCACGIAVVDSLPDYNFANILGHTGPTTVNCQSFIQSCGFEMEDSDASPGTYMYQKRAVYLYGTQYFEIYGNYFECASGPCPAYYRATGIYGQDASFSCHSTTANEDPASFCLNYTGGKVQNRFIGLSYGIRTDGSSLPYTLHLDDNYFDQCFVALWIKGGTHHVIHANNIRFTDSTAYWTGSAATTYNNLVWLDKADNFIFYGNTMVENKKNTAFLYVDSSGTDRKQIAHNAFINTLVGGYSPTDIEYGLYFDGDNRDQIVTCNYFDNHRYCIYASTSSKLSTFGTHTGGVGNVFLPETLTPNNEYNIYNASIMDSFWYYTDTLTYFTTHYNFTFFLFASSSDSCADVDDCRNWVLGVNPALMNKKAISVFPDPAGDHIIFDFAAINQPAVSIRLSICDILGHNVGTYSLSEALGQVMVNTTQYANGVYVYRLMLGGNMEITGKFEVKH